MTKAQRREHKAGNKLRAAVIQSRMRANAAVKRGDRKLAESMVLADAAKRAERVGDVDTAMDLARASKLARVESKVELKAAGLEPGGPATSRKVPWGKEVLKHIKWFFNAKERA